MSHLSLFLLGAPRIELDDQPVRLVTRKATALLIYLAVTDETHSRDSLVNLLWPDYDQTRARTVLRRTLYALNKALAGGWLDADRETIGLNPDSDIRIDVHHFHNHLAGCGEYTRSTAETCPACPGPLIHSVDLYRDDFLTGFSLKDSVNFDDWQFFQAQNLRREFAGALERLVRCHTVRGEFELAIGCGRRWLELDPLHESAHCRLMELYSWNGQRSAALRQYQACVRILREQVDASPLEATTRLYEAVKAGRVPKSPVAPDLEQPEDGRENGGLPASEPPSIVEAEVPPEPEALPVVLDEENRLVTVLFVDTGTSVQRENTPLEDKVFQADHFLRMIERVLSKYGGYIDRFLGESVLAVFGGEKTHENDPELAIRAAIELRGEAKNLGLNPTAGINTGGVYFRKTGSDENRELTFRGQVVHLAVRLASKAEKGQIWVEESTYRHTHRAFEFTPLSLKIRGRRDPVTAYQVEGLLPEPKKARGIEGLEANLIGRDQEFSALREALHEALEGHGQMVSLIGEAGVGKSRLVSELKAYLQDKSDVLWLEGRCLEMGRGASYWPFIDIFREYFAWRAEDDERTRAERIVSSLREMVGRGDLSEERYEEIGPLLGNLLSVRFGNEWDERQKTVNPEQTKNQTFMAVRDFLLGLARRNPVVLVFEDLHWADSLSLDLISLLMETLTLAPLFLLCVYRPEREHKCWHLSTIAERKCPERYTELPLRELTPQQSQQMVESLLNVEDLPRSVNALILEKAQGNPFFVEEVVRSLIDSGVVYRKGAFWRAREEIDSIVVPERIQSVIMGRVDRLEDELRNVLQGASVMGRLFRRRLLACMIQQETVLESALLELEDRGLIYEERAIPEEEYSFKHVLMQEAFYQSIPQRRREALHRKVAEAIEVLYRDSPDEHDEQLAYHYDKSGHVEKALEYLYKAGEKAVRSSANEEAIAHLTRGLELLKTLPETRERFRRELDFQISLGVPVTATRGYAAPEVEHVYTRAQELCRQVGETPHLFPAIYGLFRLYLLRANMGMGRELAQQLMRLAQTAQDPALLLEAHRAIGATLFHLGEFDQARDHCEKGIALYDPRQHRSHSFLYGHDPAVSCLSYIALALWSLGYPDQALQRDHEVLRLAQELSHPFSLVYALSFATQLHQFLGRSQEVQERTQAAIRISAEQGFPFLGALATNLRGWALTEQGEIEGGIAQMRQGLAAWQGIKVEVLRPYYLALLAKSYGKAGQAEAGLNALAEALVAVDKTGARSWEAELYRLKGELLLQKAMDNGKKAGIGSEAETCFRHAIEVARRQRAKSLELRAAVSLSRLWRTLGKGSEAQSLLAEVYDWFTEGLDTADLKEAKALLCDLARG